MTYFGFLLWFLAIPALLLWTIRGWLPPRSKTTSGATDGKALGIALGVQIALALIYTTPWDNYLVATAVWHYDTRLVTGVILGYVPLEEYIFFVLDTLLVGLWWQFLSRRISATNDFHPSAKLRMWCSLALGAVWLAATVAYFSGWRPGTYLLITLAWALPPIILQIAFGGDVLWHHRKLVGWVIFPIGLYLSFADLLAIRAGIWAIDPAQSTGLFIGGLPLEEGVFFFATAILITFGLTLTLSAESRKRFHFVSQVVRERFREVLQAEARRSEMR